MFKEYEKLDRERKRKNRAKLRLQKDEVQMGLDEVLECSGIYLHLGGEPCDRPTKKRYPVSRVLEEPSKPDTNNGELNEHNWI